MKQLEVTVSYQELLRYSSSSSQEVVHQKLKDAGFDMKKPYQQEDSYYNQEIVFKQEVEINEDRL